MAAPAGRVDVGDGLLSSCAAGLVKHGVAQKDMRIVTVPGALEIPLTLKKMAQSGKYDALIALGAVIRGETYHFEIVSNESSRGITDVQLSTGVPIANGILTTENDDQAEAREIFAQAIELVGRFRRRSRALIFCPTQR